MSWRDNYDEGLQEVKKSQPFRRMIPNLITIGGMCCGLSAIRFALIGRWELCIGFIVAAAVIDGLDGRAARLLRASSTFGAQLDSLSDFVCFGVAPVMVLYIWELHGIRGLGWATVLFFSACTALRLARFNTAIVDNRTQPWQRQFFTGVPSPAGGLLVIMPLLLATEFGVTALPNLLLIVYVLTIGILMVSRIPTYAAKNLRIKPEFVLPVMILCASLVVLLIIEPWLMMIVLAGAYLCSIPFSVMSYRRLALIHSEASSQE